nr:cobyric acid synthase [Halanaerobacter jeridensis]
MVQGTASHVGKSVITSALSRILVHDGYRVAPFKSQNMALNSYVTKGGGEIGRAQAVQAEAAKVEATVDMNPILLKPKEDTTAQVIIHGQVQQNMTAKEYFNEQQVALTAVQESLARLKQEFEVVVIEGAGSPAEVNLREYDLVNMKIAKLAQAPVILVADIDRGGVFASIVGTLELLTAEERERIEGIIINKFRGQKSRLEPGLDYIEEETGIPILGVIPYFDDFKIPEEDAIASSEQGSAEYELDIAVINLPHISNFTDFAALAQVPETRVRYVAPQEDLEEPDLIILPGTKNTIEDLECLYQTGVAQQIIELAQAEVPVVGICGGYQMLGRMIYDPYSVETEQGQIEGLGLLDIETTLAAEKITAQVQAEIKAEQIFAVKQDSISGYEIHMGHTRHGVEVEELFTITQRSDESVSVADGASNKAGTIWGTYLHGIFDNDSLRREFINQLRVSKGLAPLVEDEFVVEKEREQAYQKLADLVRDNLDMELLYQIISI